MKPLGTNIPTASDDLKRLRKVLKYCISLTLIVWLLWLAITLSLTAIRTNDTIGLSLAGGLVIALHILIGKELKKW